MRALSRSLTALLIAAAASAAVLSHYVIDVIADYLVPHASFDDVASHGSRGVIGAIAVLAAFVLARRGFRLCCEAAANRGARATSPPSWWSGALFVAATVAFACIAVPLMEIADARWGGAAIDGLDDAYGGSVLLGIATTAICGILVGTALFAVARWLLSRRDRIVAAIASAIRRTYKPQANPQLLNRLGSVAVCQPRLVAFRRGKRAPPRNARSSNTRSALLGEICYTPSLRRAALSWATSTRLPGRPSLKPKSSSTVPNTRSRPPTRRAIFPSKVHPANTSSRRAPADTHRWRLTPPSAPIHTSTSCSNRPTRRSCGPSASSPLTAAMLSLAT